MFLSKPKNLIYVTPVALWIFNPSEKLAVSYTFSKTELQYSEVVDGKKLKESLVQFFAKHNLRGRTVIVFSANLVFFDVLQTENIADGFVQEFLTYLPIDRSSISVLHKIKNKSIQLYAINSAVLPIITESLNIPVESVTFATAFKGMFSDELNFDQAKSILKDTSTQSAYNLLKNNLMINNQKEEDSSQEEAAGLNSTKNQLIILFFCIIFFIFAVLLLLWKYEVISIPFLPSSKNQVSMTKTTISNVSILPSFTPTPTSINRNISLQILNGSEVDGLAKKISDEFLAMGYKNIEIANADSKKLNTTVDYNSSVPPEVVSEITKTLESSFASVSSTISAELNFDAVLVLGEIKK